MRYLIKKQNGEAGITVMITVLYMVIILFGLLYYTMQKSELNLLNTEIYDGLVISNLSSAVLDDELVDELDISNIYFNEDTGNFEYSSGISSAQVRLSSQKSYDLFKQLYIANIKNAIGSTNISNLEISVYTVYNVIDNDVYEYAFNSSGTCVETVYNDMAGVLEAPNGVVIDKTSLYAKISFTYTDYFGNEYDNLSSENCAKVRMSNK